MLSKKNYRFKYIVCLLGCVCGIIVSLPLLCLMLGKSINSDAASAKVGIVTAKKLNLRSGAGTEFAIVKQGSSLVRLTKGTKVNIVSTKNGWYNVTATYNGSTVKGYVIDDYISASTNNTSATISPSSQVPGQTTVYGIGTVTASNLNVRKSASASSAIVTSDGKQVRLAKDTKLTIISKSGTWYYVSVIYNKKTVKGYVAAKYVKAVVYTSKPATTKPTTSSKPVAVKTVAPTANPAAMTTSKVTIKVYATVSDNNVNVRSGASTSSSKIMVGSSAVKLTKGTKVEITGQTVTNNERWYRIVFTYMGTTKTGFVHGNYITLNSLGTAPATTNGNILILKDMNNTKLMVGNTQVSLTKGTPVVILAQMIKDNNKYFKISFTYMGKKYTGVVKATNINVSFTKVVTTNTSATLTPTKTVIPTATAAPTKTVVPTATAAPTKTVASTTTVAPTKTAVPTTTVAPSKTPVPAVTSTVKPLTDAEYKKKLADEGFPESYIEPLLTLHKKYPNWEFSAFKTGLDFHTALQSESKVGLNLTSNSRNISWLSMEKGAYVWETDTFTPFDGKTWVTASKSVVAYYLDPRNFLDESQIFMFELLSYKEGYQTKEGVENILKGTCMYDSKITYVDENGKTVSKLYSDAFMDAAKYSLTSPYHLASRSKQEIVTSSTSLSNSVSGIVEGYEGLYNYYNIGASNSTLAMGAIKNGLNYAKNGGSSASLNEANLIPWNNRYRAIVGGANFIGATYIQRGQNTIYLEKFNVTSKSTYYHQYMANVSGAATEAARIFKAYSAMDNFADMKIAFSIPVYENLPSTKCALPANMKNPNNWLKTLSVDGYALTPTFDVSKTQEYGIIVEDGTDKITINATTVSAKATVLGTGEADVPVGLSKLSIKCTAEDGTVRTYILKVSREK